MPPRSRLPRRLLGLALAVSAPAIVAVACDGGPAPTPPAPPPGRTVEPTSTWSRADFTAGRAPTTAATGTPSGPLPEAPAGTATPTSPQTPDPLALADLLRAVPTKQPSPTDPDAGTLIGTETGEKGPATPLTIAEPPHRGKQVSVSLGALNVQSVMASPAIEREARAQLYYPLVSRCKDADGKTLPPDAVLLEITIDVEGYILHQNTSATAQDPKYSSAAECMRRELLSLPFRGPEGARGILAQVKITLPSVD